jgi:flagellar hook assembly protein FlgD
MPLRTFTICCVLIGTLYAVEGGAQVESPERAATLAGRPVISVPAHGDTLFSMWTGVQGAIPEDLLGKCREVGVLVNGANRGTARLRGVRFSLDAINLDCLPLGTPNSVRAVCLGPSLRVESDELKVMYIPGPLEIEADLSTDAISPARSGGSAAAVEFKFNFSTPADWTLTLAGGADGNVVRGATGVNVPQCEYRWDGMDGQGNIVPDGEYMYEVVATSTCGGAGQANHVGVITVDTSIPGRPGPVEPVNEDIVSPNFQIRWGPVQGAWFYEIQLSEMNDFEPHEIYSTGASQLRFSGRSDGFFYWRVRAVSRGGNPGPFSETRRAEVRKVMKPAISMLGVTTKAEGTATEENEEMRVTYMANDNIVVTIRIVTAAGEVVRTLLNEVTRTKGAHVELWDGRDDNNELVTAGAYIARVEAAGTEDVTPFSESRLVTVEY